ncbi:SDR family NAD(P)-dependent oxidoreductase [Vibrio methylphosphonaticus]|uniref:SDR family NAD(P)-dependent oxidoreductase n=1 Tax=Vibrio methylphosphonaticus TaxID=2946866 RepID=UPI002029BA21|nr:SDR family NAD(P)-dependent oxidoreductase [Vibrio methylphosphonaticus]MCL9774199.1 SDR family NAD(P)-dependent oxidoreductase [Vibrio methylphosphonaticus]
MMNIAIWGAASGLGAAMVDHFYEQGFNVIAIARDPSKNVKLNDYNITSVCCDATDEDQVKNAVSSLPENTFNISTMGSFHSDNPVDYIGHRYLIDSLEQSASKRLLLLTSLGCGDSWKYLSDRAKRGFGSAVREKTLAEAWLQTSNLEYTILRPGGLKDGAPTNQGVLSQHREVHGSITRGEVARLSHELLLSDTSLGQIFQCVDPSIESY